MWIERDGVLVEHDPGRVTALLGLGTRDAEGLQIEQGEVGVRAAGDRPHPFGLESGRQRLRVLNHVTRVLLILGGGRLLERHGFRRHRVHQRTALHHREHGLVDRGCVLGGGEDHPATRSPQDLVRGERDDIGVRHRARDRLARDQTDEVRRIHHEDGSDLVSDLTEGGEVDQSRDGRATADDHLGLVLASQVTHLVVVDVLGRGVHAVVHRVEPLAGEGDLGAVGEVSAVRQAHGQHLLAGLDERPVHSDVRRCSRMGLEVRVVGIEQRLGPLDADGLRFVHFDAAAVIAPTWVTLGVLVAQRRTERGQDGRTGEVLTGDQLQAAAQPVELTQQDSRNLGVLRFELGEIGTPERDIAHGCSCDDGLGVQCTGEQSLPPGTARAAMPQ